MQSLYLIDGHAQFFRAYHAIRSPMTSPVTREPTNMTFGFVGMLLRLLRGDGSIGGRPDYLAVAIDVSGDKETFRSEIYPQYKANRPPPPEDLRPQIDRAISILRDLGVPVLGVPGFEADDVIASLVTRLGREHPDLLIRIVSKDKDLKQLLSPGDSGPRVEMFDVHTDQIIDAASLREMAGIEPGQVIDVLALMGDAVDNVPGVEGVGEKTATKLIAEHGSLDALLAHADQIKGKRGERIRAAAEQLDLSRRLVTLRHDVDLDFDLASAAVDRLGLDRLLPICRELGFNRYQREVEALASGRDGGRIKEARKTLETAAPVPDAGLFDSIPAPARPSDDCRYDCVRTESELSELIRTLKDAAAISVDTETTSRQPLKAALCGLSFAVEPGRAWYVPVRSPEMDSHLDERTVLSALKPVLEDPARPKIGHNLKYDLLVLRGHGVELRGLTAPGACDTMIASYLIDPSRSSHRLDALALALLGHTDIPITDLIGTGKNQRTFDQVPLDQATPYAAEDAEVTLRLAQKMMPDLRAMGLDDLADRVEMPLVEVLAEMQFNGIRVDPDELDHQRQRLEARIDELRNRIGDEAMDRAGRGFNPDSPKQLASILFSKPDSGEPGLGIKPIKRTKTGYSTDSDVLDRLASDPGVDSPIPELVLEYRQLTKLVGTYLVALKNCINPRTGRIHASFNQTVAATGRLSSSDPNLQNIPIRTPIGREIRRAFVAEPGHLLISADYSQIELRLLAHLSGDPALTEAFHAGQDIHVAVAARIHAITPDQVTREQRDGAKMVNFGIVYGITPYGLARRLDISTTEASRIIDEYKTRFSGITTFLQECIEQAKRFGCVETMLRRRRPIADIESRDPRRRALAERMAINSVVQGSAADLIKLAMIDLHGRLSEHAPHWREGRQPEIPGVQMLIQIHDELVFEAPEPVAERARALVVERMERAMDLSVPLVVESSMGRTWFEGK